MSDEFQDIYNRAVAKGKEAALAAVPVPMQVVERANPFDSSSEIVHRFPIEYDGVCGFAWIIVKPGTSRFARWLKEKGYARSDSYYGGVCIWISDYNQSMARKEAHAMAMAKVLKEEFPQMKIYPGSRMD